MQTIDKLISQLQEGDMVQLATKSDKRILAFYEGRCPTSDDDHNYFNQIWLGHKPNKKQPNEEQIIFSMANPRGVYPDGQDYGLECLLPELYMTSKKRKYFIEDYKISKGRILDPSKFIPIPDDELFESEESAGKHTKNSFKTSNRIFRITLPGCDNYVVANVVAIDEFESYLLLSPISGWADFSLYVEVSEDSDCEGTLYIPERSSFLSRPEGEEEKILITNFKKVPVTNIEYYSG
ncbi:MAG: hypothetical protein AABW53_02270 [Nanoarchaeota archaeon]